jgi:acyl-CoA thioesterase FadM
MQSFTFREPLRDEWLDPYGHLNEGYYCVAFANAGWDLLRQLEIGVEYFQSTGCAFYVAESHLRYLKDIRAPAMLETESMLFGCGAKRMHYGYILSVDGVERATMEGVCIHIDTKAGRSIEMPVEVQERLRRAVLATPPSWLGRAISLGGKK